MRKYDLENRGNTPLYEYLYKCIRDDIRNGNLRAGEKIPSKRFLAQEYGISLITVQNAYEQLVMEGYLDAVTRKGYFVADIVPVFDSERAENPKQNQNVSSKPQENRRLKKPDAPILADLANGSIGYGSFPYDKWSKLTRKTLADEERNFLTSPEHLGLYELRRALSDYLRTDRGLFYEPQNIVIGAGTEYLYTMVVWLLGRNGMYAVEDPGYLTVSRVFEANGVRVLHIPVDDKGFSIKDLNVTNPVAIHISPSHQFPTGIVMPAKRRHDIIEWSKVHGCYIIEDDYDSEFRFQGRPIPAMASLDREHVIYMNTFSKTISPSVRIAFMALPDELADAYRDKLGYLTCPVSVADQMTLAGFIDGGFYARHLSRMKKFYRSSRDSILEKIKNSDFGDCINIREEDAGLHFLMEIKDKDIDMGAYIARMKDKGILIKSVSDYSSRRRRQYDRLLIFNYSGVMPEELPNVFRVMKECLRK